MEPAILYKSTGQSSQSNIFKMILQANKQQHLIHHSNPTNIPSSNDEDEEDSFEGDQVDY